MQNMHIILKQYFGYDNFRAGQDEIISRIVDGVDCLCVMPTGAGKSLCFQIPALMMPGVCLVISPLISLMKDQVNALVQAGVRAAYINSSLTDRQVFLAMENAKRGVYKIIYVAPERLDSPIFMDFAARADISMVTVDEAHCISQWGQDFRPSYLRVTPFVKSLAKRPVVSAFTATATPAVRDDITQLLDLQTPKILVAGFDRKNLYFDVKRPKEKFAALLAFLGGDKEKSGIVYCATRATVEKVCEDLNSAGYAASRYHGGLSSDERNRNQEDFLHDRARIMIATNAFGMGIDKSNVRFVLHYNMPMDIEGYYQEAGRAGRDGEDADCLLFYAPQDMSTNLYLIENATGVTYPDRETEQRLKSLNHRRLRIMQFYCHNKDCLRQYILEYFGEKAPETCNACANCAEDYRQRDISTEAQKILSCVIRSGERYGVKTIIDILRGAKRQHFKRLGLANLSTYNISTLSETELSDIVYFLANKGYLFITEGEYPVLKKGPRAAELLRKDVFLEMKMGKDAAVRERREPRAHRVNNALFDALKEVRLTVAGEQGVPAFVIFSDSTLTDMCVKMPRTPEEFLTVSGVGEVKLERYGKIFLDAIAAFPLQDLQDDTQPGTQDTAAAVVEITDEPVPVSVIADRISCLLVQRGEKRITGAAINNWLLSEGYLHMPTDGLGNGKSGKRPTKRGLESGITEVIRTFNDQTLTINHFSAHMQRFIVDNYRAL